MGRRGQQEVLTALRPGPVPGPPVRADAPRPPGHGRDAVRAARRRRRTPAGCSSSAAATAATSCRWPTGCAAARSAGSTCRRARSNGRAAVAGALALGNVELAPRRPHRAAGARRRSTTSSRTASTRGSRRRRATRCSPPAARTWPPAASPTSPTTCCPAGTCARSRARCCAGTCARVDEPGASGSRRRGRCSRRSPPPAARATSCAAARLAGEWALAAGRRGALPRRAGAAPRGRAVHRTSSPTPAATACASSPRPTCSRWTPARCPPSCAAPTRSSASSTSTSSRAGCSGRRCCATPAPSCASPARRSCAGCSPRRRRSPSARGRPVEFRGPRGSTLTTDHEAVKRRLRPARRRRGRRRCPSPSSDDDPAVAETLRRAYAANLVQPPRVGAGARHRRRRSARVASALARLQAAEGTRVTTLRHTSVEVADELGRRLIALLDGTRDRAALVRGARAGPRTSSSAASRG